MLGIAIVHFIVLMAVVADRFLPEDLGFKKKPPTSRNKVMVYNDFSPAR